jgi:hypothetical protein
MTDFKNIRPKAMTISEMVRKAKKIYGFVLTDFDTGVYIELKKSSIKSNYKLTNGMDFNVEKFWLDKHNNLYIN